MLTGFATASFLAFGILLVLFGANASEIIAALSLDYAELGLLGSMLSLGLGIGVVSAGPLVDRGPWRPIFVASCGVVVLATTTLGPTTSYAELLVHMAAIGLGAGFYETVVNAMVIEVFGASARKRLLVVHSAAALAACTAPLVLGWAREAFDVRWYESFRVAGLLHVPLILAAFRIDVAAAAHALAHAPTHAPAADHGHGKAPAYGEADGNAAAWPEARAAADAAKTANDRIVLAAICVATFCYVGVESALTVFVVDFVSTHLDLDALRAARTISAFWGGLFVGRVASGLVRRSPGAGTAATLSVAAAAAVVGFGLVPMARPELVMAAVGLALSSAFPVLIGLAGRVMASAPATAVGLAGGLGSLGGFVVPWLTGGLASVAGLPLAIATLGGWLLLLAAGAGFARLRHAG